MKYTSVYSAFLLGASVAVTAPIFAPAPAQALSIGTTTLDGDPTIGNPPQQVWKVDITSTDVNKTFNVDWKLLANTLNTDNKKYPVDLLASSLWTITSFSSNKIGLTIDLANDTDLTGLNNAKAAILSFGFGVDPNATATIINNQSDPNDYTIFESAIQTGQQQFPGGFKQIDVCLYAANNCDGGNVNQGLQAGQTDTIKIELTGSFTSGTASLMYFPLKFQTNNGSYELAGVPEIPDPGEPVPEPITMFGLGVGLAGGGLLKQKYGKKANKEKVTV